MSANIYSVSYGAMALLAENTKKIFLDNNQDTTATDELHLTDEQRDLVQEKVAHALKEKLHLQNSEQMNNVCDEDVLPVVGKAMLEGIQAIQQQPHCSDKLTNKIGEFMKAAGLALAILNPETNIETDVVAESRSVRRKCKNIITGQTHLNQAADSCGEMIDSITEWYTGHLEQKEQNKKLTRSQIVLSYRHMD